MELHGHMWLPAYMGLTAHLRSPVQRVDCIDGVASKCGCLDIRSCMDICGCLHIQGCPHIVVVVVVVVAEHLYSAPGVMEPQKRSWLPHKVCFQILLKSLQTNIQVPHIRWKSVPKTRPRYRETSIAVALKSPGRTDEISSSS